MPYMTTTTTHQPNNTNTERDTMTTTNPAEQYAENIFGEVVHVYTRAQAIEDGVLIDISEDAGEAGFVMPVAMTAAAWAELVAWTDSNRGIQDEAGRLWDVLTMARYFAKRGGSRVEAEVLRVPNTPRATAPKLAKFVMACGPGDNAEPVITLMLPGED